MTEVEEDKQVFGCSSIFNSDKTTNFPSPINFKGYFTSQSKLSEDFLVHQSKGQLDPLQDYIEATSSFLKRNISIKTDKFSNNDPLNFKIGEVSVPLNQKISDILTNVKKGDDISIDTKSYRESKVNALTLVLNDSDSNSTHVCSIDLSKDIFSHSFKKLGDNIKILLIVEKIDTKKFLNKTGLVSWDLRQSYSYHGNIKAL